MNSNDSPPAGDARRQLRTINAWLCVGVLLTCGASAWRTHCDHSRFGNFVESLGAVKLPIPPFTIFVGSYRDHAIAALILVAGICGFITWRRTDRQSTLIVNISGIVLAMGWGSLQTWALYQATMTILEGIAPGLNPR